MPSLRPSALFPLFAVAVLGACTADIPTPTSPAQLSKVTGSWASNAAQKKSGIPNALKYRDSGVKPGTGRAGSATLEVQAMIGRDGSAVVEASTGSLEAGTTNGAITKVQLKTTGTRNFDGLVNNGYWSGAVPGLESGQRVQVQATVRGADPKRTSVVTATATTARRPDVTVRSVTAAANVPPHTPVMITGVVSELNGDVGARANCVLSINGLDVDQATGIWVDAAETVSCMFSYSFAVPGTYDVRVTASGVAPGDWDTANNTASSSVRVVGDASPVSRSWVETNELRYAKTEWSTTTNPSTSEETSTTNEYNYSTAKVYGFDDLWVPGPILAVDMKVIVNGVTTLVTSMNNAHTYGDDDGVSQKYYCSQFQLDGRWATVCSNDYYGAQPPRTYYEAQVASGSVTYFAQNTYCDMGLCNTYTNNSATNYFDGHTLGFDPGATVRMVATFWDASGQGHELAATTEPLVKFDLGLLSSSNCVQDYLTIGTTFCFGTTYSSGGYETKGFGSATSP